MAFQHGAVCLIAAPPLLAYDTVHIAFTSLGGTALALWPALTVLRRDGAPRLCEPRYAFPASAALVAMLLWTGFELTSGGNLLGLAERITAVSELLWPSVVVLAASRTLSRATASASPVLRR